MKKTILTLIVFSVFLWQSQAVLAKDETHFFNPIENFNRDPNYVPGQYDKQDTNMAESAYYLKQSEYVDKSKGSDHLVVLGGGDITFSSTKNESAEVLGYFREYYGYVDVANDMPKAMFLVINVNSLDTSVPGRNNRILDLFFRSFEPELGKIVVEFKTIEVSGKTLSELSDGQEHTVDVRGNVFLNGQRKEVKASVTIKRQQGAWHAYTAKPITLFLSDFNYEKEVYALMKSCNHKSISDKVDVMINVYLK